ncbi:MAG: hypothetical protein JW744_03740 [Candidatus Diapherotrites archaeon]|uniref:Uncharacterized protein n=1 Tax=Candidatus Iainarchaeum sp. TaxID=3101447 RepID=A0A938YNS7_9ARCH|nr:hypothetical protein [Candidatus Diapherotrites archaeon]
MGWKEDIVAAYALGSSFVVGRIFIEMMLPVLGFMASGMTTEAFTGTFTSLIMLMVRVALPFPDAVDIILRIAAAIIFFYVKYKPGD